MCAITGAIIKTNKYTITHIAQLKKNTVEKSISSASFFCTNAEPIPLSTKTWSRLETTVTIAIKPYSSGAISLAIIIVTTKLTPCAPQRSASLQKKLEIVLLFMVASLLACFIERFQYRTEFRANSVH